MSDIRPNVIDVAQWNFYVAKTGARAFVVPIVRTFGYLWFCRKAVPWYCKAIFGLAAILKCCPIDFGTDEALTAVGIALLSWKRPGLWTACKKAGEVWNG